MHDRFHDTNMSIFRVTKRNYSHIECYNYDLFAVASTMSILFMKNAQQAAFLTLKQASTNENTIVHVSTMHSYMICFYIMKLT